MQLSERANAWLVIAMGIWLQALPFLLLGIVISSLLGAFVKAGSLARFLPRRAAWAVPVASLVGVVLPACECASVPTTRSLVRAGVPTPAALAFMAASPAVNPVVIASTAMAYTAAPRMAVGRFVAGLLAAVLIGLAWTRFGRPLRGVEEHPDACPAPASEAPLHAGDAHDHVHPGSSRWQVFRAELVHDLLKSGGFLVIGAAVAATIKTVVPQAWLQGLTAHLWLQVPALALLAVLVALCSEADAFMAVSLTAFSPVAQLVFLAVGPVVDVKLMAMQGGAFGTRFLARFVPIAAASCLVAGTLVGLTLFR